MRYRDCGHTSTRRREQGSATQEDIGAEAGGSDPVGEEGSGVRAGWGAEEKVAGEAGGGTCRWGGQRRSTCWGGRIGGRLRLI
jgi:hypothetical protein